MATRNIKFRSLDIDYIYIKFNGLIVPATAFFQDDVCGKIICNLIYSLIQSILLLFFQHLFLNQTLNKIILIYLKVVFSDISDPSKNI